jgi:hypothetical protein
VRERFSLPSVERQCSRCQRLFNISGKEAKFGARRVVSTQIKVPATDEVFFSPLLCLGLKLDRKEQSWMVNGLAVETSDRGPLKVLNCRKRFNEITSPAGVRTAEAK